MMSKFSTQHHIIGMMSIMMCTHVDCFLIIKQAANIHNLWSTFVSCWFFFSSVFLFVFWYYLLSWMGIFLRKMLVISTRQEDYIFQPNSWEVLISITGDFSLPVSFSLLPPFPSLSLSLSLSHPLSLPPSLLSPFLTLSTSLSPSLSPLSLTPSLCLSPLPPSLSFPPSLSPSFLCLPPFLSGPSPSLSYPPSLHPVWLSPPLPLSLCVHLFFSLSLLWDGDWERRSLPKSGWEPAASEYHVRSVFSTLPCHCQYQLQKMRTLPALS